MIVGLPVSVVTSQVTNYVTNQQRLDTAWVIETPEGVELSLCQSGPVLRMLAWLIDTVIRIGVYIALVLVLVLVLVLPLVLPRGRSLQGIVFYAGVSD